MTTTTSTRTDSYRRNAKCKCGKRFSQWVEKTIETTVTVFAPVPHAIYRPGSDERRVSKVLAVTGAEVVTCCGAAVAFKRVNGTLAPEVKCDGRCTHATGHNCNCSCGGKNHGAN